MITYFDASYDYLKFAVENPRSNERYGCAYSFRYDSLVVPVCCTECIDNFPTNRAMAHFSEFKSAVFARFKQTKNELPVGTLMVTQAHVRSPVWGWLNILSFPVRDDRFGTNQYAYIEAGLAAVNKHYAPSLRPGMGKKRVMLPLEGLADGLDVGTVVEIIEEVFKDTENEIMVAMPDDVPVPQKAHPVL